jgi:cold shock protein
MRERGRVLSFDSAEGHGIIRSDAHGDDLFVHFSFIRQDRGFRALTPGQYVEFDRELQPGPSGSRFAAQSVVVVAESAANREEP